MNYLKIKHQLEIIPFDMTTHREFRDEGQIFTAQIIIPNNRQKIENLNDIITNSLKDYNEILSNFIVFGTKSNIVDLTNELRTSFDNFLRKYKHWKNGQENME